MADNETICPICCCNYTKVARKEVTCSVCQFVCCTNCVKTFLLNTNKDPHCMKCNVAWNRQFIDDNLSKNFRTSELKKHRENVLVDREKSLLPATIPLVEREMQQRKYAKELSMLQIQRQSLLAQILDLDRKLIEKRRQMYNIPSPTESKIFQRPCPTNDCRGYLSSWKCSLCNVHVCSKCHMIKADDEHTCKEEDVATAALLEKDTKYCPNESCRSPIFKIDGCSQIFCTKCHTAFDWKTGQIESDQTRIHNPHFYQWLRQQNNGIAPRNVGDVPCGGLPTIFMVHNTFRRNAITVNVDAFHRGLQHIQYYEIPRHPITVHAEIFANLRVRYLLKEISEDDWKRELQKIEKKQEKNTAFRHVFDMILAVGVDMFNQILEAKTNEDVGRILDEAEQLRIYFNTCIEKLGKRFSSSTIKQLTENWVYRYVVS
jgi:hypothetical protein